MAKFDQFIFDPEQLLGGEPIKVVKEVITDKNIRQIYSLYQLSILIRQSTKQCQPKK